MARILGLEALRCANCWEHVATDALGYAPTRCPWCGRSPV